QVCAIAEGDPVEASAAAVRHRLETSGIVAVEDVALVLQLLDLPVVPQHLAALSPPARQARPFALLRPPLLDPAPRQPPAVVVENLHWIDATSEAWLTSLVERLPGVTLLLLVTYRPGYQPPWGARSAVTQLALPPLRPQDSLTVVRAVPGATSLTEVLLQE